MNKKNNSSNLQILAQSTCAFKTVLVIAVLTIGCTPPNTQSSDSETSNNPSQSSISKRLVGQWTFDKSHLKKTLMEMRKKQMGQVTAEEEQELDEKLKYSDSLIEFNSDGSFIGSLTMSAAPGGQPKEETGTWEIESEDGKHYLLMARNGRRPDKNEFKFIDDDTAEISIAVPKINGSSGFSTVKIRRVD